MSKIDKEVDSLYERCGIQKDRVYPTATAIKEGELNNHLHTDWSTFERNSVFSYSACGASSVGSDWLSKNGYIF